MQIASRLAIAAALVTALSASTATAALTPVPSFGTNPGNLAMYEYVPASLPTGRPLVLVLHGCSQTAASMEAAGWNKLADQFKFTVVYPEQNTANNPVRCFNWAGEYGDTANLVRGQGENASVIAMIDKAVASHGSDPKKVYIVGFSAGGAMAAVMLATWPEKFAGGAIMSGLPYRCATTVNGAYSCQSPGVTKTATQWGDLVRAAATFTGVRPRIQIWHGASDSIVVPMNEDELIKQWTDVFGTDATADETQTIGAATRTAYKSGANVVVEAYKVTGMGHATAIGADVTGSCPSTTGAYFEDKGICATMRAAQFLGLTGGGGGGGTTPDVAPPTVAIVSPADGDTVTGKVTIVVAANDETKMGSVSLTIDGAEAGTDEMAPFQFEWDATAAGPGAHALVATARDAAGNMVVANAMVTVPQDGSGPGNGSDDPPPGANHELPGCSLDASGGGAGFASGLSVLFAVLLRRRRR